MRIFIDYKGRPIMFITEATDIEKNKKMVVYKNLDTNKVLTQSARTFYGEVFYKGEMLKRFQEIEIDKSERK